MIYIYIAMFLIYNLLLLISTVDIDTVIHYIDLNSNIGESKLILKIDQGKINLDLVQEKNLETNNKMDSVDVISKEDKCKVKKFNPLEDIHKRFLFADKSHLPSHFQKNCLPKISEDVPVYGNKLVTFEPSSILRKRNLPEMFIELPKSTSTNMGKSTELLKAISGADEAVKLYDTQAIKFSKVLSGIRDGTEEFYPKEAKPLMETYVDLVAKLSHQQKVMANEAINQLKKLDSNFSRNLYPVENN